jgi:hypothetical protein
MAKRGPTARIAAQRVEMAHQSPHLGEMHVIICVLESWM